MSPSKITSGCCLFACISCTRALHAGGPTFTPLGDIPQGLHSNAAASVSADGLTVCGGAYDTNHLPHAYIWKDPGPMIDIGPGASWGISSDGIRVVGTSDDPQSGAIRAYIWTEATGRQYLQVPPGATDASALAISNDGLMIVGGCMTPQANPNYGEACYWTENSGMIGLGGLTGPPFASEAYGVSVDKSTVVGVSALGSGYVAFRWNESGFLNLGNLPGDQAYKIATAVSSDGTAITGFGAVTDGVTAFRWTPSSGMTALDDLSKAIIDSAGYAISADGNTVVGYANDIPYPGAMMWTPTDGVRSIYDMLVNKYGLLEVAAWQLEAATGISPDGKVIVGYGYNASGYRESWRVVIPSVQTCLGDVNDDGKIDLSDLALLLSRFGLCAGDLGYFANGDLNEDGCIELSDLASVLAVYGNACR